MGRLARATVTVVVLATTACKGDGQGMGGGARGTGAAPPRADSSAIAGTWRRVVLTLDENANDKLDDAERKPLGMDFGYSALDIRADGGCDLESKGKKGKGTCKLVEEDGKSYVEIEAAAGGELDGDSWKYLVLARSDRELVIKDPSGSQGAIYAYERR